MNILKLVMIDKRLTTSSKVIFAYLYSCFDERGVCSKSRDEFSIELNIGKDTFDKNVRKLAYYGYIYIYRSFFCKNVYALPNNIEKIFEPKLEKDEKKQRIGGEAN